MEYSSHSKLVVLGSLLMKSQSSFTKDLSSGTRGERIFSIILLKRCVGDSGPAMMGRPFRLRGQGIWMYSSLDDVEMSMISLHLCTLGVT